MKKLLVIPIVIIIFCMSSCRATTTMTDHPADYIYALNEEIKIRDIESGGELGTLIITDAILLKEEPFEIPMFDGYREDGTAIYQNENYEALVQVNYIGTSIDSRNKITNDNFTVKDSLGEPVEYNPALEYTLIETEQSTMVIALKNKGEFIDIHFSFHNSQSGPTAKIRAALYDKDEIQPSATAQKVPETPSPTPREGMVKYIGYNQLAIICILLLILVTGLSIALGLVLGRRKKQ